MIEILISIIILCVAASILYKNIKKKKAGVCNCSNCSSHCSSYNKVISKKP